MYLTVSDLMNMELQIPRTRKGIILMAQRQNWQSRKRQGRGGGLEYAVSSMPADIQHAILSAQQINIIEQVGLEFGSSGAVEVSGAVEEVGRAFLRDSSDCSENSGALETRPTVDAVEVDYRLRGNDGSSGAFQVGALETRPTVEVSGAVGTLEMGANSHLHGSTQAQRQREGARIGVIKAIEKLMDETHAGKDQAITTFLVSAQLPHMTHIANLLRLANDKRGNGHDVPTKRTIHRWFKQYRESGNLLPKLPQANFTLPEWFKRFLAFYRTPQKPSVQSAFELFLKAELNNRNGSSGSLGTTEPFPTVHQARRWLAKIGNVEKQKGRLGTREIKNLKPYKVRDFKNLLPTDVYSADGHTFDAEILHPDSGKPFRPEITTVVDIATRKIVGWSVDLAESGFAVLSAICQAIKTGGIPALFYVDNGGGYRNALMSDQSTGLMGRLGITMTHSLPYSSQARGVIERLHQSVWVKMAKQMQSYIGADMDKQASQAVHKTSRQLMKQDIALKGVPALSNILSLSPNLLPDFDEFKQLAISAVEDYNNRPHSSLPKITDVQGFSRHMTPNELWALKIQQGATIHKVDNDESLYLFLPQVVRTVQRGQITLHKNTYFSNQLTEYNGDSLRVAFDIHNAEKVWLFDDVGRFICSADWNGNSIHYMPISMIEQAKEKRITQQIKRLDVKRSIVESARPTRTLDLQPQTTLNIGSIQLNLNDANQLQKQANLALEKIAERTERTELGLSGINSGHIQYAPTKTHAPQVECQSFQVPNTREERFQLFQNLKQLECLSEQQSKWIERYAKTAECRFLDKQQKV